MFFRISFLNLQIIKYSAIKRTIIMKKNKRLIIKSIELLNDNNVLVKLIDNETLPEILPGQFVQVKVEGSPKTFLRRPISVNFYDVQTNELWLLVQMRGDGTKTVGKLHEGDMLEVLFPLGNGFSLNVDEGERVLLVGGGVGTAPLLFYGKYICEKGGIPLFLLGGKTANDVLQLDLFEQYGDVFVTTEDGSAGEKGFVTQHSMLSKPTFTRISVCGPKPMMMAVAQYAIQTNVPCEVSLENLMACGLGACLCCVEKTVKGNVCVCTDGPVFNINQLTWF